MSYNYSKGAQVIGDLKAADDAERNTLIDFGEDVIDFQTSGSVRLQVNNNGVYIPDTATGASLFVSGGIQLEPGNQEGIRFANKGNNELNFISFQEGSEGGSFNARMAYNSEEFLFIAPGRAGDFFLNTAKSSGNGTYPFSIMDDGTAKFTKNLEDINERSQDLASDIAFYVSGTLDGNNNALFEGNVVMSGGLNINDDIYVDVIRRQSDSSTTTKIRLMDEEVRIHAGNANDEVLQVGDGTVSQFLDPTGLSNDTGTGEVVKFGSGTLTAGKLYYLYSSTWTEVDADAVASGAECLLGIALGSNPATDGVLIRGFFNANSYLSNFDAGKAVYISTTAGSMDTNKPTGSGDFVRIVGYCTTTANVIYFNPSSTWVEL